MSMYNKFQNIWSCRILSKTRCSLHKKVVNMSSVCRLFLSSHDIKLTQRLHVQIYNRCFLFVFVVLNDFVGCTKSFKWLWFGRNTKPQIIKAVNVMPSSEMIYKCDKTIAGSIKERKNFFVCVSKGHSSHSRSWPLARVIGYWIGAQVFVLWLWIRCSRVNIFIGLDLEVRLHSLWICDMSYGGHRWIFKKIWMRVGKSFLLELCD